MVSTEQNNNLQNGKKKQIALALNKLWPEIHGTNLSIKLQLTANSEHIEIHCKVNLTLK